MPGYAQITWNKSEQPLEWWAGFFVPDGFIIRIGSIDTLYLYKKAFQMFFCLMQILIGPIWTFYLGFF